MFCHIQNITEHEKLLKSLKPENPKEIQKTFFDALNNSNDAVLKSIEKLQLDMSQKFKLVDMLQRKIVWLHISLIERCHRKIMASLRDLPIGGQNYS